MRLDFAKLANAHSIGMAVADGIVTNTVVTTAWKLKMNRRDFIKSLVAATTFGISSSTSASRPRILKLKGFEIRPLYEAVANDLGISPYSLSRISDFSPPRSSTCFEPYEWEPRFIYIGKPKIAVLNQKYWRTPFEVSMFMPEGGTNSDITPVMFERSDEMINAGKMGYTGIIPYSDEANGPLLGNCWTFLKRPEDMGYSSRFSQ